MCDLNNNIRIVLGTVRQVLQYELLLDLAVYGGPIPDPGQLQVLMLSDALHEVLAQVTITHYTNTNHLQSFILSVAMLVTAVEFVLISLLRWCAPNCPRLC